jgi:two-component system cell cycle sensor histidine kinase/response regulator CckA
MMPTLRRAAPPALPADEPGPAWLAALGLVPFSCPLRWPLDLPAALSAALPGLDGAASLAAALEVEHHLHGLSPTVHLEWSMNPPDPRTLRARARAITAPSGEVTLEGVWEDVSAEASARAALAAERDRLHALIECLPEAIFLVQEGRLAACNAPARALGAGRLAAGEPVLGLVEPTARAALATALVSAAGRPLLATPAGAPGQSWELTASPAPGLGADARVLAVRDVTARVLAERRAALGERLATVGRLAAGVAHEVNNPLSFVTLNLETLEAELPRLLLQLPPEAAADAAPLTDALADALVGSRRVSEIVGQLRRFAHHRAESGPTAADPREGIQLACQLARHALPPGVQATVRASGALPAILLDAGRLSQILINLLVNAGDAIAAARHGAGSVCITAEATVDTVDITVEDDGPGIPSALADRIFEPFFTTKEAGSGSGLGLSIVRTLVEDAGGEIALRPTTQGACFQVRLPRADRRASRTPATRAGLPRLLLIDDEPALCRALAARLRDDWDTTVASDGQDARAAIERGLRPDVLLCDIMMPRLDGRGFFQWLLATHPALAGRVVFMTAAALGDASAALLQDANAPVLVKPLDIPALRAALRARAATGPDRRQAPRHPAAAVSALIDLGGAIHKAALVDVSRSGLRVRNGAIPREAFGDGPARLLLRAEAGGQLADVAVRHVWSRAAAPGADAHDHAFAATAPIAAPLLAWLAADGAD